MKLPRLIAVTLALLAGGAGPALAQNYVVIVNASVPAEALRPAELARIFQRQAVRWPGGSIVEPVDLAETAPLRERFSQDILGKSAAQVKAWWETQLLNGAGVPPIELSSEQDVIAYVQTHGGAIAYVSSGARLPAGVRRLSIAWR